MTTTLGFVGLGAMGGRMARRLLDGGFALHGYNRTPAKAADLVAAGMTLAASPREVAERAEAVFTMVTDDAALEAVTRGPQGIVAGLRPGAILVEMSTVSPAVIHRLAGDVAARGSTRRSRGARPRSRRASSRSWWAATRPCWNGPARSSPPSAPPSPTW